MSRLTIQYNGISTEVEAETGETLLTALQRAEVPVLAPCGGRGHCKKCRVKLTQEGHTRPVLACTTPVTQDCTVEVPVRNGGAIAQHGRLDHGPAGHHGPGPGRPGYGIAVDLGTTTVVVQLYRLAGGYRPLDTAADWNVQAAYGGDVISRVQYIMTHDDGLETLSAAIRGQVFGLAKQLCDKNGVAFEQLTEAAVAGNTIMQHIFAGLNPSSIAVAPYTPSTLFLESEPRFFPECPGAAVRFSPCVAGYVGGDITAGLLYCALAEEPGLSLFLDIGTNGEMALCDNGQFFCCSVASGPAFEGAEISCGMPGIPGAVSHVSWRDGAFQLEVIGDEKPVGLCGSGLIDLLAVLLELEIVDETGRLLPPDEVPETVAPYVTEDANGNGIFHLTPEVSFTAGDVRKLQLAKAAVAAGIEILLSEAGKQAGEVETVFLAGGFGDNLNPDSAAKIGMIPAALEDKIFSVGNSSLSGVRQMLMNPQRREALLEVQRRCRYLELSGSGAFSDAFIEHMTFEEA